MLIKTLLHKSNLISLRGEDTWFNLVPRNGNLNIFFQAWIEMNSYKQEYPSLAHFKIKGIK